MLTSITNVDHFKQLLNTNPGVFIVKFGATWCQPCKKIEAQVLHGFSQMPENVQCASVDIDECFEIYAFLKSKKMVNGIPVILAYYKDRPADKSFFIPDGVVMGTDLNEINMFFESCYAQSTPVI